MANLKFRYMLVILLLVATSCIVTVLGYDSSQDDRNGMAAIQAIPKQFGEWTGNDIPLDEQIYKILETRAILHRNYISERDRQQIFLSIVHYTDTKVDFHAPESCLGGSGLNTIKSAEKITLDREGHPLVLEVAKIISTGINDKTLTLYFYKAGNFIGQNYSWMRLNIARNKFLFDNTNSSLIRVSTSIEQGDEEGAHMRLVKFISEIYPSLKTSL